jgi:hypothetical protein
MTRIKTVNNHIKRSTNQFNKEVIMPNINSQNSNAVNGMKELVSMAIWNKQFQRAEAFVKRGLRHKGFKATGLLMWGVPGAGKTHFATKLKEEMLTQRKWVNDHYTLPVIMISAPQQSLVSNLVQKLLFELGDINPKGGKPNEKIKRLHKLLRELDVSLIIVDEVHDFLPKKGCQINSKALSFLKELMDETKIPMLFMGTERARLLNTANPELGTRIRHSFTISELPYGKDDSQKYEFAEMATEFAKKLPKQLEALSFVSVTGRQAQFKNTNLLDRFYVATHGLPRGLRDIFLEINLEIEDNPNFTPNLKALAAIYNNLECMNDYIDFNPFDSGRLDDVKKYIVRTIPQRGLSNEAA